MADKRPCPRRTERPLEFVGDVVPVGLGQLRGVLERFFRQLGNFDLEFAVEFLSSPPLEETTPGLPGVQESSINLWHRGR
ncbi:hypothetical protein HPB47_020869 [Ixodes persulcatus]|uniref:Uncharacterized protein n=1 Tax=Ixodes persulcatus TaxID=34615 RepID=A0AC60QED1_IXOPE|nr:hypothetical protein HPB47_020869 [Ixodes persulcatus]